MSDDDMERCLEPVPLGGCVRSRYFSVPSLSNQKGGAIADDPHRGYLLDLLSVVPEHGGTRPVGTRSQGSLRNAWRTANEGRSEERRVGKECVGTGRIRWS